MFPAISIQQQNHGAPRLNRRLRLVLFIVRSLPHILREIDFTLQAILDLWQNLLASPSSLAGRMVTFAARARKGDNRLYLDWIESVEVKPEPASEPLSGVCVLVLGWQALRPLRACVQGFEACAWVSSVRVLNAPSGFENYQLDSITELQRTFVGEGVLVVRAPCLPTPTLGGLSVGDSAVTLIFDHDYLFANVRERPFFKPGVSAELFAHQDYTAVVYSPAECFLASEELNDNALVPTQLLQDTVKVAHRPIVGVHFLEEIPRTGESTVGYLPTAPGPLVSVLVPTRDRLDLLKPCIDSLVRDNPEGNYEIIVLDNQSSDAATIAWLQQSAAANVLTVLPCNYDFNWSRLNNDGVSRASGEVIVFLNNDTVSMQPGWIARLGQLTSRQQTGAVGPLLLYPEGEIQHAGVVVGYGGYADHVYVGANPEDEGGVYISPLCRRQVAAVTGACLAVRKTTFIEAGGMDELLEVAGDLDLCLRLHELGYHNIYEPGIRLIHKESRTRKKGLPKTDREHIKSVINRILPDGDPFFNPNLSLNSLEPMPALFPGRR